MIHDENLNITSGQSAANKGDKMKKLTKQEFEEKLNKLYPNHQLEILEFESSTKPLTVKCKNCGKINTATKAVNFLRRTTYCDCQPKKVVNKYIEEINNILNNNENLELLSPIQTVSGYLDFKCNECGYTFSRQANDFVKSGKCPYCSHRIITTEMYSKFIEEKTNGEYTLISEYINDSTKVLIRHNLCGFIYKIKPTYFKQEGTICPKCKRFHSKGEKAIINWLEKYNVLYEREYRFKELASYPFDFKIDYNNKVYVIEFQGEQHYKPREHFGGEKGFERQQQRDKIKKDFCIQKGYNLIEIPYYEINNIDKFLQIFISSTTISKESTQKSVETENTNSEDIV